MKNTTSPLRRRTAKSVTQPSSNCGTSWLDLGFGLRRFRPLQRLLVILGLVISIGLVVFTHVHSPANARSAEFHQVSTVKSASLSLASITVQPHPLPPTLAKWQDDKNSGDYFSQVKPTEVGYLVWSQFPIKVYIEQPEEISGTDQAQKWFNSVFEAVQEWNIYLPLVIVESKTADITIWRSAPPLGSNSRARSAETRYELYINTATTPSILSHRCTILLNSSQTNQYLQAAARHELGHALGIWGHSSVTTDALYFSQVRNPLPISPRDLNTLKRVYEQPTQLGWALQ